MADDCEMPSMSAASVRKTAWILLFSLFACYLSLAPATTSGRGYVYEDMQSGLGLLTSFNAWIKGRPVPPISWTRHGPVALLLDLPFIKLGKNFVSPDFVLSLQPLLLTAAMLAITYLWLLQLCTPGMSLLLTLIGAFGTMLWPYAYIGLETKQSFFVLLAGYVALANGKIRTLLRLILFSTACGLAVSAKSTGIVLAPAVAYLISVQFGSEWRSRWKQLLAVLIIASSIWTIAVVGANFFWGPQGGGANILLGQWTTDSPFQLFSNLIGIFGSPNKGLFVFAPVLLLSIWAIPKIFQTHREIVVFTLLVTTGTVALVAILVVSADEVWGPRFLHISVAPLLVCIGAAWPRFNWRVHVPVMVLGVIGVTISFLGAFFYYGARSEAAQAAGQNTLEWFAGDTVWNEVALNGRLFHLWLNGGTEPVLWTPVHHWAWVPPQDAPSWKTINLRQYAQPQSYLLYYSRAPLDGSALLVYRICWISLIAGPLLLAWVIVRTINITTTETVSAAPVWR
jgi:hypothetical protein